MPNYLDLQSWKRREQFFFFLKYENPFFNICADVDVTSALELAKQRELSFFILSLFLSSKAANSIEEFRYRIQDKSVLVHDVIHPGSTVLNSDETFGFCYFTYDPDFAVFNQTAISDLQKFKDGEKSFDPRDERDDLIHYSVIPWVSFRSFAHARRYRNGDSIPKIVLGKYYENGGRMKMPVSVEVHHSLMDGLHVGRFYEIFQENLKQPPV